MQQLRRVPRTWVVHPPAADCFVYSSDNFGTVKVAGLDTASDLILPSAGGVHAIREKPFVLRAGHNNGRWSVTHKGPAVVSEWTAAAGGAYDYY